MSLSRFNPDLSPASAFKVYETLTEAFHLPVIFEGDTRFCLALFHVQDDVVLLIMLGYFHKKFS